MPLYFIFSLGVSIVLALALLALLITRLQVNWTGQNKIGIAFLLPVVITIIFVLVIYFDTQPKVVDLVNLIQGNTKTVEAKGTEIITRGNNLIIKNKVYLISPFYEKISDEWTYRFTYLPNSSIVVAEEHVATLSVIEEIPIEEDPIVTSENQNETEIEEPILPD